MNIKIETYLSPLNQKNADDLELLVQMIYKQYSEDNKLNILDVFDNAYYKLYTEQIQEIYQKFIKVRMVLKDE